ncbi:MAG: carboxypeptidase regulatory-like domain-containing protein [Acidobacteriota bacterium]|nr:carboxypeptidase regulatory-like domain-containing protein [Acidobacteriota bacterium]
MHILKGQAMIILLLGLSMYLAAPVNSLAIIAPENSPATLSVQGGGSSISGHVWDGASRRPLERMRVELLDEVDSVISTTRTDSAGRYVFNGLSSGTFQVRVLPHGTGYTQQTKRIQLISMSRTQETGPARLGGGQSIQQDFVLKGPPGSAGPAAVFFQDVPAEARKVLDKALEDLDNKKAEPALAGLKKAIELFPNYYYALEILGTEYVKLQHYEAAAILLNKAVQVNPRGFASFFALGIAQYNLKQTAAALESLRRAVSLDPENLDGHLWLGIALMREPKLVEAESEFKTVITKGGKNVPEVYWRLAKVYELTKRFTEAADAMETFLKLQPKHPQAEVLKKLVVSWREKAAKS